MIIDKTIITDEKLLDLIYSLDSLARGYDSYDFGLPTHNEDQVNQMKDIILNWLQTIDKK